MGLKDWIKNKWKEWKEEYKYKAMEKKKRDAELKGIEAAAREHEEVRFVRARAKIDTDRRIKGYRDGSSGSCMPDFSGLFGAEPVSKKSKSKKEEQSFEMPDLFGKDFDIL